VSAQDPQPTRGENPALTPLGAMAGGSSHRSTMSEEDRQAVVDELFFEEREFTPFLWRFTVLIVLSTLIATLGLVANSVAVIIGAMLVAPLMTPILATSAALVLSDARRLLVSVGVLILGTVLAILTAVVVTWAGLANLTTAAELPSEIVGRTQPSLLDLGVAVAAGLAAGYVLTHPRASSSLAGVAIAVALVPPLATVGITFQVGASEESQGALLLFATNLVAIVLSAIVVMALSGFVPADRRFSVSRSARVGLVVSLALLLVIAVPLTLHTLDVLRDRRFGGTVAGAVATWDPNAEISQMRADVSGDDRGTVDLVVATTSSELPPVWRLVEAIAIDTDYVVDLEIRINQEVKRAATSG
jgi:uncharacterized hydrophobic protein (TIGR00271 family)